MTAAGPRARDCQKRIVQAGVDGPLGDAGFSRVRKRFTWIRETDQLVHIVNVWTRWGKDYLIQWCIRCEPVTTILWGQQRDPYDVAYSAITSRAGGDGGTWEVDDDTTDDAVAAMADATARTLLDLATWRAGFQTRQDCLAWLRADVEQAQVVVPSGSLRLFTAAAFAAADGDPVACALADEVQRRGQARPGKETRERVSRLMESVEPLCQGAPVVVPQL
jgi:hypothetical protein